MELRDLLAQASKLEEDPQPHYEFGMDSSSEGFVITRHKVTGRGKLGFKATFKNYSKDDLSDFVQSIKVLTGKFVDFYQKMPEKIPS